MSPIGHKAVLKPKVIFLVGPTAAGKTAVAVRLAKKLNAEIISCDSMQVYKGMDIIASKPSAAERRAVVHHLLDAVTPDKEYNVSRYRRQAVCAMRDILKRGKTPFFAGGTGLYMSIIIDGIFNAPAPDEVLRERLAAKGRRYGPQWLYRRLQKADSVAAARIHPNDTRRIIRALEVFEKTGTPISFLQQQRKGLAGSYDIRIFCLTMERGQLYERINQRVERMFRRGLEKEVRTLLTGRLSRTARYAIGIQELNAYFEGRCSRQEAVERMKKNTRNYAKRQLTWFRKDTRIQWIEAGADEKPADVAGRIKELL